MYCGMAHTLNIEPCVVFKKAAEEVDLLISEQVKEVTGQQYQPDTLRLLSKPIVQYVHGNVEAHRKKFGSPAGHLTGLALQDSSNLVAMSSASLSWTVHGFDDRARGGYLLPITYPVGKLHAHREGPVMKYSLKRDDGTQRSVHQIGQMAARFLGLDSRGPYARAFLQEAGFPDDCWMERAFPIVGRGNQDKLDAQQCNIPLDKQSAVSDCEHLFFRYKLWHHSPLFTFQTNHSRNIRHTTTRNRGKYSSNGSGDFNFAHVFCKWYSNKEQTEL